MKNLKIKVICGFRKDQEISIDGSEAHKAYYLFLNPEKRGVFNNGYALKGSDIQRIEPDYNGTMGWNQTHQMDEYDWLEVRRIGIDNKFRNLFYEAKQIAINKPNEINQPLLIL
jgi:hypothetical protein